MISQSWELGVVEVAEIAELGSIVDPPAAVVGARRG
jgi:hypothetical protein